MAFNLEDYEDVATLNKWFIANYPMGRSDISVISHDPDLCTFSGSSYLT